MISVPADGEPNLRAERPIVKKNMSVSNTTAVPTIATKDTSHIQWFIVLSPFCASPRRFAGILPSQMAWINKAPAKSITAQVTP